MNTIKKVTLATALAASALASATPAMARPYGHHGGDGAAWAIGAGILGLAVGAAVASSSHHRDYDRREYNDGYYDDRGSYRDGYYDDRRAQYDRDAYDRGQRDHGDDYRRGYDRDSYYERRGW